MMNKKNLQDQSSDALGKNSDCLSDQAQSKAYLDALKDKELKDNTALAINFLNKHHQTLSAESVIKWIKKNRPNFFDEKVIEANALKDSVELLLKKHAEKVKKSKKQPQGIFDAINKLKSAGNLLTKDQLEKEIKIIDRKYLAQIKSQEQPSTPARYATYTMDNIELANSSQETLHEKCNNVMKAILNKKEYNLFALGSVGTGKTMVLSALVNSLNEIDKPAELITMASMLNHIKSFFKVSIADVNNAIKKYSTLQLLVIDEVDLISLTEKDFEILNTIMNNRYNNVLSTAFISNKKLEYLTNFLGRRIIDRMRACGQNAVVTLSFDSLRVKSF